MGYSYQVGYTWGGFGWGTYILAQVEQSPLHAAINCFSKVTRSYLARYQKGKAQSG